MGADIRTEGIARWCGACPGFGAPCARRTSGAGWHSCWPGWWPTARPLVGGARHIDRGYEDLLGALRSLGADVRAR